MKRLRDLSFLVSALISCICLLLWPLSKSLNLPNYGPNGESVQANASVAITSHIHCAISRSAIWLFNGDIAYTGSIISLQLEDRSIVWGRALTKERSDLRLAVGRYGFERVTFVSAKNQAAGKASYGDLPGLYYRYFEWADQPEPWWTLAVHFLYPSILFGLWPSLRLAIRLMRRRPSFEKA